MNRSLYIVEYEKDGKSYLIGFPTWTEAFEHSKQYENAIIYRPGTWKADDQCARKRYVKTCYDCVRYQLNICKDAQRKEQYETSENLQKQPR